MSLRPITRLNFNAGDGDAGVVTRRLDQWVRGPEQARHLCRACQAQVWELFRRGACVSSLLSSSCVVDGRVAWC